MESLVKLSRFFCSQSRGVDDFLLSHPLCLIVRSWPEMVSGAPTCSFAVGMGFPPPPWRRGHDEGAIDLYMRIPAV
jgi:hypothetical protein